VRRSVLLAIAYHEAGHAVVALDQGLAIKSVTIRPDAEGKFKGRISSFKKPRRFEEMGWDTSTRKRQQMEREERCLLAGELAQRRHAPRSVRSYHGQTDRESAIMLLDFFAETTRELPAYYRLLEVQTDLRLARQEVWSQVEALAGALLERHPLLLQEGRQHHADDIRE
jgi:hypothetical protein